MPSLPPRAHIQAAMERVRASGRSPLEQADALSEIALDLQRQPKDPQELWEAIALYEEAERLTADFPLGHARILAGKGAALRRMPGVGLDEMVAARDALDAALPVLREKGEDEETAEAEMVHGLILQALAPTGKARLADAVKAYQRALRVFQPPGFPREFAILHNNLATAYLSMRMAPEKEGVREALAVQSFQEALKVINLIDDPSEYAMLQNNLGNALQSTKTAHRLENLARAVEAYDEALKVRTPHDTPVEYANTISNKANALMNLPDDPEDPDKGNPIKLQQAVDLLVEAGNIFQQFGLPDRAQTVAGIADNLRQELASDRPGLRS
ncbi:MAG: hypothetical protein VX899_25685 [Myxococcota bacterium]|nr:hypothetical protein [Myxococcota bacterium]